MTQANMHEAKSKLSQLAELAHSGETVVIAKAGKPYVDLVPPLFVRQAVVLELVWVLTSAFKVSRPDTLAALSELLSMSALGFQDQSIIRDFLVGAHTNTCDLPDLLIAQIARRKDCETTLTFDEEAAKTSLFTGL